MTPLTILKSSTLQSVGHDPADNTLTVTFKDGRVYRYKDVPASVHTAILGADSPGKAFQQHVKNGGFGYERVDQE